MVKEDEGGLTRLLGSPCGGLVGGGTWWESGLLNITGSDCRYRHDYYEASTLRQAMFKLPIVGRLFTYTFPGSGTAERGVSSGLPGTAGMHMCMTRYAAIQKQ